jgi:hypothetical protein
MEEIFTCQYCNESVGHPVVSSDILLRPPQKYVIWRAPVVVDFEKNFIEVDCPNCLSGLFSISIVGVMPGTNVHK